VAFPAERAEERVVKLVLAPSRGRAWLAAGLFCAAPLLARADAPSGAPALGLLVEPGAEAELSAAGPPGAPVPLRLTVGWSAVERERGVYDWSSVEPSVRSLAQAGHPIVLVLSGPAPSFVGSAGLPSVERDSFEPWLGFARSAARSFAGLVGTLQVGERIGAWEGGTEATDAATYAFLLKNTALAVRAEAAALGASIDVAQAALAPEALELQRRLWLEDVAAYVDVLPLLVGARTAAVGELLDEVLRHPPAPAVWVYVEAQDGSSGPERAAAAVEALAAGAPAAFVRPVASEEPGAQARWVRSAHAKLAEGYAPAPRGTLSLEDGEGRPIPGGRVLGRFFSDRDFSTLVFYLAPGPASADRLLVDAPRVRNARRFDPSSGESPRVRSAARAAGHEIAVARGDWPQAVQFETAPLGEFDLPPEAVETRGTREPSAEEIIARHQQVQKIQDDRLERFTARGRVDFHFKLAQGGSSIDVSIESNYFWERGGELEWEQTDYYINGNRVRWKKIPELPLIQPEKVITLPLDLTLDRTYLYRRVGRERIGEREAWVLEFQPADPQAPASLYRGRVWIDVESFVRLRASVIQTRLEPPILSNEEIDDYRPHTGPDGETYWMLSEIDGQQTWSAGGRTFIVRREVTMTELVINAPRPEFERRRSAAYASTNQMLRDTGRGFRYLERHEDGTRQVKERVDTSQLFAAAGAFRDSSGDSVVPLAGVNYFNYDVAGRDVQMNVFFAGVLGFFNASKPDLFGRAISASLDLIAQGIKFDDELFAGDDELLAERLRTRDQNLTLALGVPLGQFVKLNARAGARYRQFFEDREADAARRALDAAAAGARSVVFLGPQDHTQLDGTLELEFNRRGYTLTLAATRARRSDWERWGLFDEAGGTFLRFDPTSGGYVPGEPESVEPSFERWGVTAFKEWYLPRFQKLRLELNYLDGADLDRFSRYQFSLFGDERLNGFSGSGVRFDTGRIARLGYAFNLFEVIRFDAALETARVEPDARLGTEQSFSGAGLSANFVGPWKTVVSLSYGYALASDIPDLEGEQDFLLVILKLF
jgi:hypothetical protein